jgi:hypothetical protein
MAAELRSVVGAQSLGQGALVADVFEHPNDIGASERESRLDRQSLASEVIDDVTSARA